MRVIIVSPSLDSKITLGGISAVASFIVSNNHDIEYIHFEQGKRDAAKGGFRRIFELSANLNRWRKVLKNTSDAIIHYNFPLSPAAIARDYVFMKYARIKNRKIIVHVHGGLYMNSDRMPCFMKWMLQDVFSWVIPFIVLGKKEQETIQLRYKTEMVSILPNCVAIDYDFQKQYHQEGLTLGYLGRITNEKGMNELVDACRILKDSGIIFNLSLAGVEDASTNFIQSFQELLGDRFTYYGIVSGEEKIKFLKSLDIFVLPSYFEGLPMSLLECMSYGVVPVATRVGSIPELIKDNVNGCLIELKSAKAIVDKIMTLNKDRAYMEKIGAKARITIIDNYSPHKYIESLNQIYNQL